MTNKQQITDVFFDLDHTIYDFDRNSALTFQAVFTEMQLEGVEDFMTHFKLINNWYWELFARDEISREQLRYRRLKDTFTVIKVKVSDEHINHIADYFINNLTNYSHVFQDAYETLDHLKTKYRLHIITNGPDKVQQKKLDNAKLNHYFISVTNSERAGVNKPHPGIFEYALKTAQVNPESSVMIGDNIKADVYGALNVGMNAIWFNEFQVENTENIMQIHYLKQLKNLL